MTTLSPVLPRSPCRVDSPPTTTRHQPADPAVVNRTAATSSSGPCLDDCSSAVFLTNAPAHAASSCAVAPEAALTMAAAAPRANADQPATVTPVSAPPAACPTASDCSRALVQAPVPVASSGAQQQRVLESAEQSFEARHRQLLRAGQTALRDVARHPDSTREALAFRASVVSVQRNRLFVPEKAAGPPVPIPPRAAAPLGACTPGAAGAGPARSARPWRLEGSIWAGRPAWADSGSFWDDDAVVARAVLCDWHACLTDGALLDHLLKHDAATALSAATLTPDARAAFAKEIEGVLMSHGRLFLSAFDYYASLGPSGDPFHIQSLGFHRWLEECELVLPGSRAADLSHLQLIFVMVNQREAAAAAGRAAATPRTKSRAPKVWSHNSKHDLDRAEFLHCLCRVAVARFVLSGGASRLCDVSDAIERLFVKMRTKASPAVRQDANVFRDAHCYTPETDAALREHETTLRLLFAKYCSADGAMGGKRAESSKLLSCAEWVSCARDLGLVDDDLSVEDATLLFLWSRTRVVDEDQRASRPKVENLAFHDFLEVIVRCAHCKALPTDKQLARAGDADAHDFLVRLRQDQPAYAAFLAEADGEWHSAPRQPIARALAHMLVVMVRGLEARLTRIGRAAPEQHARQPQQPRAAARLSCDQLRGSKAGAAAPAVVGARTGGLQASCADAPIAIRGGGGAKGSRGGGEGSSGVDSQQSCSGGSRSGSPALAFHEQLGAALELQREVQGAAACVISRCCRGALERIRLRQKKRSAAVVQRCARAYALRRRLRAWPRAAQRIQALHRGRRTRATLGAVLGQARAQQTRVAVGQPQLARDGRADGKRTDGTRRHAVSKGRADEVGLLQVRDARVAQAHGPSDSTATPLVIHWPHEPTRRSFQISRPSTERLLIYCARR